MPFAKQVESHLQQSLFIFQVDTPAEAVLVHALQFPQLSSIRPLLQDHHLVPYVRHHRLQQLLVQHDPVSSFVQHLNLATKFIHHLSHHSLLLEIPPFTQFLVQHLHDNASRQPGRFILILPPLLLLCLLRCFMLLILALYLPEQLLQVRLLLLPLQLFLDPSLPLRCLNCCHLRSALLKLWKAQLQVKHNRPLLIASLGLH